MFCQSQLTLPLVLGLLVVLLEISSSSSTACNQPATYQRILESNPIPDSERPVVACQWENVTLQTASKLRCHQLCFEKGRGCSFVESKVIGSQSMQCALCGLCGTSYNGMKGEGIFVRRRPQNIALNTPSFIWKPDEYLQQTSDASGVSAPGITGSAIHLDGVNDCINMGNYRNVCFGNLTLCPNGVTYAFWIKLSNVNKNPLTGERYYISGGGHTKTSDGFTFLSLNGEFQFRFKINAVWWLATYAINSANLDIWHHLVVTWKEATGVKVYINGCLEAVAASSVVYLYTPSGYDDVKLGCPNNSNSNGFKGECTLDDFIAYDWMLAESDVMDLFHASIAP